jgi:hypothetical protein
MGSYYDIDAILTDAQVRSTLYLLVHVLTPP